MTTHGRIITELRIHVSTVGRPGPRSPLHYDTGLIGMIEEPADPPIMPFATCQDLGRALGIEISLTEWLEAAKTRGVVGPDTTDEELRQLEHNMAPARAALLDRIAS